MRKKEVITIKPSLYLIPSFDKTKETTIKFSWLGNIPVSNTLRIKDNTTNEVVYEVTQSTMRLEHTISSTNNLVNGKLYNASVRVTDGNNSISEWSDVALFYCFSTPTFSINIESGQIIQAQTYGVNITYAQSEGELLQSYRVRVYNSDNTVIYDSNLRYILDTVKITNLQDNGHYSILVDGTTVNGMNITTGRIDFSADFIKSEAYFVCELENMYETGGVYIKSNIVSVEGSSDNEMIYIDNDVADLTNNVVYFNKNFSINGDFSLLIKGKQFKIGSQILKLIGRDEIVNVYYRYDDVLEQNYFELNAKYKHNNYMITLLSPTSDDLISLWINRKNSLFSMEVIT